LQWSDISAQSDDVASYQVYYKPNFTAAFVLLGNYSASAPFIYSSDNPKQIAGCYAVGATDKTGNVGVEGPEVCVDICPEFELPNVFSPNGDDANDHFKALRVKQINEINLAVLDRWGNVVFETKDPYFEWDGISQKTGIKCSDGVLVYVCTVFEPHITGTTQRRLSSTLQLVR
jgi:gliding motility-associated-like protein